MIRAGALRQRVTVQALVETPNTLGQMVQTWTTSGPFWAEVVYLSGREAVNAQQIKAETTHRVRMRWMAETTITPKHQLVFKGRVLKIQWINNVDERDREIIIFCTEVVSPP